MDKKIKPGLIILFVSLALTGFAQEKKMAVDYVNPYIGSINPKTRGVTPIIKLPGGTVSLFPTFTPQMQDLYLADKIYGFPLGFGSLMISSGVLKTAEREIASKFDHDLETATPYYYQALLEDPDINAEFTVTDNTVFFRFILPRNITSNLLLTMGRSATVEIKDNKVIEGSSSSNNRGKRFFCAQLGRRTDSFGTWKNDSIAPQSRSVTGDRIGLYASYKSISGDTLEVKIGISSNSVEEARAFIAGEVGRMSFDQVKEKARKLWNDELNLISVKGGTEKQRTIFYSALYRTRSTRMGNVWDTYRCAYPLQTLIKPEETLKAINGFIKTFEETGWLPSSGAMIGNHSTAVIVDSWRKGLRDFDVEKAYAGMKKNATEATMIPWKDAGNITELEQCYFDKGFYPALPVREDAKVSEPEKWSQSVRSVVGSKMPFQITWLPEVGVKEWVKEVDSWHRRQSVSVTLEHCYDDWCLAQIALDLGKKEDYQLFMKRAHNYRNLYKPSLGMMAPKSADGQWIEPFDPRLSGGFAGEGYFAEANSWIYTWHVQHDVQGLINLMGGKENFVSRLNTLFTTGLVMDKMAFQGQFPDMSGLIGMYCQGNEPSFHIPYLYNYAGQPWMTQSRVRQIMDLWYDSTPFGLCGDDDGGAMTSWYVLSAIGIYPQCPGQPVYDIGSPVFAETVINVGNGKSFVIESKNVSARNKYIQSATLNGQTLDNPWISHADVVKGGKLVFQMGDRPNRNWGSKPGSAAPSMSSPGEK
jgi:putative alpha-1,2-mannosidase